MVFQKREHRAIRSYNCLRQPPTPPVYTFYDPNTTTLSPYVNLSTGEVFIKTIVMAEDAFNPGQYLCPEEITKVIQLDLSAIRVPDGYDTVLICEDESKLPYRYDVDNYGKYTVTYAQTNAQTPNNELDKIGDYIVTYDQQYITSKNGCDSIVHVHLKYRPLPTITFTQTPDYCDALYTTLTADCDEALLYKWNTGEVAPAITIDDVGIYTVEVVYKDNCTIKDSIAIGCPPFIHLPNTFSPGNHDGVNDYFFIPQSNLIQELEFTVFNRHGGQVYHTTNKNFQWNGTEKGKLYVGTTYTYILRYKTFERIYGKDEWEAPITGTVTIL